MLLDMYIYIIYVYPLRNLKFIRNPTTAPSIRTMLNCVIFSMEFVKLDYTAICLTPISLSYEIIFSKKKKNLLVQCFNMSSLQWLTNHNYIYLNIIKLFISWPIEITLIFFCRQVHSAGHPVSFRLSVTTGSMRVRRTPRFVLF